MVFMFRRLFFSGVVGSVEVRYPPVFAKLVPSRIYGCSEFGGCWCMFWGWYPMSTICASFWWLMKEFISWYPMWTFVDGFWWLSNLHLAGTQAEQVYVAYGGCGWTQAAPFLSCLNCDGVQGEANPLGHVEMISICIWMHASRGWFWMHCETILPLFLDRGVILSLVSLWCLGDIWSAGSSSQCHCEMCGVELGGDALEVHRAQNRIG